MGATLRLRSTGIGRNKVKLMKLKVEGMTCSHCERAITRAIAALGGTAYVDIAGGIVVVDGVGDFVLVQNAIEQAGYRVVGSDISPSPATSSSCCGCGAT